MLRAYWDALRAAYTQALKTPNEREAVAPLFDTMIEGVGVAGAMTRAQVHKTPLPTIILPGRATPWALLRRYGAPALCLLSSAACILSGQSIAALLSLAAGALTGVQALHAAPGQGMGMPGGREEIVTSTPLPDVEVLLERTQRSVRAMDALLTRCLRVTGSDGPLSALTWTRTELESVQMLWEAYEDGDGEYALKAVPMLLSELKGQQVTLRRYGDGADESFDLLPGLEQGRTIRPALYAGERLLVRGQATCEAEKVKVTGL